MQDPQVQLAGQVQEQPEGLWQKAPAWRNLTIAAAMLTAAAVAIPLSALDTAITSTPTAVVAKPVAVPSAPAPAPAAVINPAPAPAPAPAPTIIVNPTPVKVIVQQQPAPIAQPQSQQQVCSLAFPDAPTSEGFGVVLGFQDPIEALGVMHRNEVRFGGQVDPDYAPLQRVIVKLRSGRADVFILPKGVVVQPGDRVSLQTLFRNQALPCNYVPPLITADLGPVQQAANTAHDEVVVTH